MGAAADSGRAGAAADRPVAMAVAVAQGAVAVEDKGGARVGAAAEAEDCLEGLEEASPGAYLGALAAGGQEGVGGAPMAGPPVAVACLGAAASWAAKAVEGEAKQVACAAAEEASEGKAGAASPATPSAPPRHQRPGRPALPKK